MDGIQPQSLFDRPRRQAAVAAVLVAESLSESDAVDCTSHLPPRAVSSGAHRRDGAGIGRQAGRYVGIRRRLQVLRRQQQLRGQQPHRSSRWQVVGCARTGAVSNREHAEDNVFGFETQVEVSQFLLQTEWARGKSLGQTRTGYYLQPALRIDEDWLAFYRLEQLESPRIRRAERRHLAGLNFRTYPQIAFKGEALRSQALQ